MAGLLKLLLDEMLPRRLAPLLGDHEVGHVVDLGWRHVSNGQLLRLAEQNGYHVLITKDNNMPYQQNLSGCTISLLVLAPEDQTLRTLFALAPAILSTISNLQLAPLCD